MLSILNFLMNYCPFGNGPYGKFLGRHLNPLRTMFGCWMWPVIGLIIFLLIMIIFMLYKKYKCKK